MQFPIERCFKMDTPGKTCDQKNDINPKLLENDDIYENLIECSTDSIIIHDGFKIVFANQTAERAFDLGGYKNLSGKELMDFVHPNFRYMVRKHIGSLDKFGKYAPLTEITLITADGRMIPAQVTMVKIMYKRKPLYMSIIKNIPEQKIIEKELKRSDERYRKIIEFSQDAIFVIYNGRIAIANEKAVNLTGMPTDDILGESITEVLQFHPSINGIPYKSIEQILEQEAEVSLFEQKLTCDNGIIVEVEITAAPFPYKGGSAFLLIIHDISYRKKAEEEITLKAKLLDSVTDAIRLHDLEGNIIYINEAACKIYGYTKDEAHKLNVRELFPPEDVPFYSTAVLNEVIKRGDYIYEGMHMRKDKTIFPVEVHASVIDTGVKKLIASVSHDISERKRAEEQKRSIEDNLKQLNDTLEYEKLKTEFFSNISHELRTPLNVILGTVQLIEFYYKKGLLESREDGFGRHIQGMKKNCYRLLRLLNNLIDISKIDAGYIKPNFTNCDIVSIVEDITQSVVEYAEINSITLLFDTKIEEKYIACDPDKIERIVLNLLSNAIKFTKPNGRIKVKLSFKNNKVLISVQDNGIGIPKDKLDDIFERFHQVDSSLNRNYEGSGIGLSLVKCLIEMHKGSIMVKSEWGKGSEFIVEIPSNLEPHTENVHTDTNIRKCHEEVVNIELSDIY